MPPPKDLDRRAVPMWPRCDHIMRNGAQCVLMSGHMMPHHVDEPNVDEALDLATYYVAGYGPVRTVVLGNKLPARFAQPVSLRTWIDQDLAALDALLARITQEQV